MLCFDPFAQGPHADPGPCPEKKALNSVKVPSSFDQGCIIFFASLSNSRSRVAATVACRFIFVFALLGHSGAEHLCAEEATLGALDDLLVDAHGRVVHDDGAGLVVDFGVDASVADEVNDPLLTLVLA